MISSEVLYTADAKMNRLVVLIISGVVIMLPTQGTQAVHLTFPLIQPPKDTKSFHPKVSSESEPRSVKPSDADSNDPGHKDGEASLTETWGNSSDPVISTPQKQTQSRPIGRYSNSQQHNVMGRNSYQGTRQNFQLYSRDQYMPHYNDGGPRNGYTQPRIRNTMKASQSAWKFKADNVFNTSPSGFWPQPFYTSTFPPRRRSQSLPSHPIQSQPLPSRPRPHDASQFRSYPKTHGDILQAETSNRLKDNIAEPDSKHFIHDLTSYYYKRVKFTPNSSFIRTVPSVFDYGNHDFINNKDHGSIDSSKNRRTDEILDNTSSESTDLNKELRGKENQTLKPDDKIDSNPEYYPPTISFGEPYFEDEMFEDEVPSHRNQPELQLATSRNIQTRIHRPFQFPLSPISPRFNGRIPSAGRNIMLPGRNTAQLYPMRDLNYAQLPSGYEQSREAGEEASSESANTRVYIPKHAEDAYIKRKNIYQFNGHGGPFVSRFK